MNTNSSEHHHCLNNNRINFDFICIGVFVSLLFYLEGMVSFLFSQVAYFQFEIERRWMWWCTGELLCFERLCDEGRIIKRDTSFDCLLRLLSIEVVQLASKGLSNSHNKFIEIVEMKFEWKKIQLTISGKAKLWINCYWSMAAMNVLENTSFFSTVHLKLSKWISFVVVHYVWFCARVSIPQNYEFG